MIRSPTAIVLLALVVAAWAAPVHGAGSPQPDTKLNAQLLALLHDEDGASRLSGAASPAGAAREAGDEIGVLVRVSEGAERIEETGARVGSVAGDVVTAYATREQVREIAALPNVIQVSAGAQRYPARETLPPSQSSSPAGLDVSRDTTNVEAWHELGYDGTGVIIGIVDTGIDYTHLDFRAGGGDEPSSRILRIWDQTDVVGPRPNGYFYGTEWTQEELEADIAGPDCPPDCTVRHRDTDGHGTHVSSTAAGDGSAAPGFSGMAPGAYIVHVKSAFSDPAILDGAAYIFEVAKQMGLPAVVNLSLGSQMGPHDGTSMLEAGLGGLLQEPGRAMAVAAGNDGAKMVHAEVNLAPGGNANITFNHPAGGSAQSSGTDEFDFWYDGEADVCFTVTSPNGHGSTPACRGDTVIQEETPDGCITAINTGPLANGDSEVIFYVDGPSHGCANDAVAGTWTINVAAQGSPGARVDGWISPGNNRFEPPFGDTEKTVMEPGSAPAMITAGSFVTKACWDSIDGEFCFNPPVQEGDISSFSGRGPNRPGDVKPDITAPGQRVFAARSRSATPPSLSVVSPDSLYVGRNGTSMATPHVAGAAALLLQAYPEWTQAQVKAALTAASVNDSFTGAANNTWGTGKLSMPPPPVVKGDVDCNNEVEPTDALALLVHVSGGTPGSACIGIGTVVAGGGGPLVFGDIDCDLDVDAVDGLQVLRHVAALPVNLGPECSELGVVP